MVSYTVFVPVVVALFLAILSVYVYVHKMVCKSREELIKALRKYEKSVEEQVDKLGNHIGALSGDFQELQVALTNRLTAIETRLELNSRSSST